MVLLETAAANVVAVKIFDAGGELMMLGPNNSYGSTPALAALRLLARRRSVLRAERGSSGHWSLEGTNERTVLALA